MGEGRSRFEDIIRDFPEVPGFKFDPTDEQFINPFLQNKNEGTLVVIDPIRTDQDIIRHHPVTIQAHYPLLALEKAWFFYTSRVAKYPNIGKLEIERAGGFWMVSKRSVPIGSGIGHKRVLNFMEGSVKSYTPTNWYMEEYSIKKYNPYQEDKDWIIVRIYQQLIMPMPLTNIVPKTMPLSIMPIPTTFPLTMSMPTPYVSTIRPQGMLQPTYVLPSQSPRSQLISAGSLSPDPGIQTWADSHANSGGWSGSAYYLPLDSGEGDISGSEYPFQPPGSGGTGMEGGRSRFENIIRQLPAVPGFKFHPTNEEVINLYLQNKIAGNLVTIDPIRTDQDIISCHPGAVQDNYPLLPPENAWWFYTSRGSKYPKNSKLKIERAGGYWKVSKASDPIGGDIGFRRVLNFREGSLKSSTPTNWYMEEYSIKKFAPNKEDENWIIVRIYQQLPRPQLISAGSLSPNLEEIQSLLYLDWNSGAVGWSGSAYPFEPLGVGGTGTSTSACPSLW